MLVIRAGNVEYIIKSGIVLPTNDYLDTPEGAEHKELQVVGDNTDPINDDGDNPPVSPNKAPPAAPFPAKSPPDESSDDEKAPKDGATVDDMNPEYVGGTSKRPTAASKIDPAPLPNPEGGALAPNPDNATNNPKGGVKQNDEDQNADSLDDDSAKPNINQLNWYMGKKLAFEVDTKTGLAKWPLSFKEIADDIDTPNKHFNPNAEPKHRVDDDAEEVGRQEKPYVAVGPAPTKVAPLHNGKPS